MTRPRYRAVLALALAPTLAVSLAACGSSSGGTATGGDRTGAGTTAAGGHVADVTITAAQGCELNATSFAAGGLTFRITNKDATAVSEVELLSGERIVGEKENVPPGLGGQFAANVAAGSYMVYCPGAATEKRTITVTGKAAHVDDSLAALLTQGTAEYKKYVDSQVGYLVTSTGKLDGGAAWRQPGGRAAGLHRRPALLREDRAGRRVVRHRQAEPRRRHRRPRR